MEFKYILVSIYVRILREMGVFDNLLVLLFWVLIVYVYIF